MSIKFHYLIHSYPLETYPKPHQASEMNAKLCENIYFHICIQKYFQEFL